MAGARSKKVKIFQITQDNLALLGIKPHQSIQRQPFNVENVKTLAIFVVTTISSVIYVCRAPNDFMEYNQSLCYTLTIINTVVLWALVIWKQSELFKYINDVEIIVNESKL